MSKFKVGDKVRCVSHCLGSYEYGEVYEVGYCTVDSRDFGVLTEGLVVLSEGCMVSNVESYQAFEAENFELVEPKDPYEDFRNLPVGTKIVLRDDLVLGNRYPTCKYTPQLEELVGSILVIAGGTGISGSNYFMEGRPLHSFFSSEMIERVITKEVQEPKPFVKREAVFYDGEEVTRVCNLRNGLEVYETKQGELVVFNSKTGEVEGEIPL